MSRRLELHSQLISIEGLAAAYYNPPENVKMTYPCIRYSMTGERALFASNGRYVARDRYSILVIDRDPDSTIAESLKEFPYCIPERVYAADGLFHFSFTLFY